MESLWDDQEAAIFGTDLLGQRVYTSRLLGRNPELVLHGGGNTSVKITERDYFGEAAEICYVKGSGWDLATIERDGFAPVRMAALLKMAELESMSDADMVLQQRVAMTNPNAPTPSIEAILHAVLPFRFVDHSHANAISALTCHVDGEARVRELYGDRVIIVPYVMPGFVLAKTVWQMIQGRDLKSEGVEGMVLLKHGLFTFDDDAKRSYELHIEMVTKAEDYLSKQMAEQRRLDGESSLSLIELATLRNAVAKRRGVPVIAQVLEGGSEVGFANLPNVADFGTRGPLTPDHSIRTKRIPAVIADNIEGSVNDFVREYEDYFQRHQNGETMLDPSPRWVIWPGKGLVVFGATRQEAEIIADIVRSTAATVALGESAGGWEPLPEKDIFEVEYWELEQAKLRKAGIRKEHQGKVALVTGCAAGIGFACAQSLAEQGAQVIGWDIDPTIPTIMAGIGGVGRVVNLTEDVEVDQAMEELVRMYGGLDIVVSNAGIFTAGQYLEDLEQSNWDRALAINLTSHQKLMRRVIPFLKLGWEPAIVFVGSRNYKAPGPGAASYSCSKAALTQLCRVAALELAPHRVRCNVIHPDAVFDTKLWTPEALKRSAERYGMTVEEYKTKNLMKVEIRSKDIGNMVAAMAGSLFGKTTGAQIPVDGGNDRVI